MNATAIVRRLESFPAVARAAVAGLSDEEARWKPSSGNWSVLEVCAHLLDEEREDFRVRLRSTLEKPDEPWPPLELDGIAERRGYNKMELGAVVAEFSRERAASVAWLAPLVAGPAGVWDRAYEHPKWGPIAAGDLLAAWAAHDALHLRQIAKRLYELAGVDGAPHETRYAGEWGA